MTDYERDMYHWRNLPESADLNGCNPKPNRKDYDEHGNKIGTQYTSDGRVIDPYLVSVYGMEYAIANARKEEISNCPFSAKHCKWCGELYCSDREYETPKVTIRTYNTINMEQQKELTAQEIVEKLIDEQKISGKEAVILLNAINKPAEWSEEDKRNYEYLHQVICNYINNPQIEYKEREKASKELIPFWERLKSLSPQPSETIAFAPDTFKPKCTLVTLQNDLKKLMEE